MASPIVESLCCVPEASNLTQNFLSTFRTLPYNVVCLVAALLGMAGASWQLYVMAVTPHSNAYRRPRILRTHGPHIVKFLAVADLCAAGGIVVRSALWLWDSAAVTGGLEPTEVSSGRLICMLLASWIHYFYTCTYVWTCVYCVDCVRSVAGRRTNVGWYHAFAWVVPAVFTTAGLVGLYAPDLQCHSSSANPYLRFLPNYLSTCVPLLMVLCVCPVLYCIAARGLHTLMASVTGRYTAIERAVVRGVQRRFLLLCLVFWLCWLPNVVNASILWLSWDDLPYTALTVLWYAMAVVNPLQAVFNSLVYPSQSARQSLLTLGPSERLRRWLGCFLTCGLWPLVAARWSKKKPAKHFAVTDTNRQTDEVEHEYYEDFSSSEYQSASSSPRTIGSETPTNETLPLLGDGTKGSRSPYTTCLSSPRQ